MFFIFTIFSFFLSNAISCNASEPNETFHRVACFCDNVDGVEKFYEKEGFNFFRVNINGITHLVSSNSPVAIVQSLTNSEISFGIIVYDKNSELIKFSSENELLYAKFLLIDNIMEVNKDTLQFAHVLRVKNIEESKKFFEENGVNGWVREQHGNGPIHYSLQTLNTVIELYPWKKDQQSSSIEHISIGNEEKNTQIHRCIAIRKL
jgi:hypothetical protein